MSTLDEGRAGMLEAAGERLRKAGLKLIGASGTIGWVFNHPLVFLGQVVRGWVSTYWLPYTVIKHVACFARNDVKAFLIVALSLALACLTFQAAFVHAWDEAQVRSAVWASQMVGGQYRATWIRSAWNQTLPSSYEVVSSLVIPEISVFVWLGLNFIGLLRGVVWAWTYAHIAKMTIVEAKFAELGKRTLRVSLATPLFRKDLASGLLKPVFVDNTGEYFIELLGQYEFGGTLTNKLAGRTLEAGMPGSVRESLGSMHACAGAVMTPGGEMWGHWWRNGKCVVTVLHVYDKLVQVPKVKMWAAGSGKTMEVDVSKWKVKMKGGDFVALEAPKGFFEVLGVINSRVVEPAKGQFACVQAYDGHGGITVAWGKVGDGMLRSEGTHSISTHYGCSGAPLFDNKGCVIGMHTGFDDEMIDGHKVTRNYHVFAATLRILLGHTSRESSESTDRRRVREENEEDFERDEPEEDFEEYEDDEGNVIGVKTSKSQHRYRKGTRKVKGPKESDYASFERKGKETRADLTAAKRLEAGDFELASKGPDAERKGETQTNPPPLVSSAARSDPGPPEPPPIEKMVGRSELIELGKAVTALTWELEKLKGGAGGSQSVPASSGGPRVEPQSASGATKRPKTPPSVEESSDAKLSPSARKRLKLKKKLAELSQKSPDTSGPKGTAPPKSDR